MEIHKKKSELGFYVEGTSCRICQLNDKELFCKWCLLLFCDILFWLTVQYFFQEWDISYKNTSFSWEFNFIDTINLFSSSVTVKKKKNDAEDTESKISNNAFLIRRHQL